MQTQSEHDATSDEVAYAALLEDLRGIVWNAPKKDDLMWGKLAAKARLHPNTVARFACGVTKRPQLRTVFNLITALGLRFALVPWKTPRMLNEIKVSRRQ